MSSDKPETEAPPKKKGKGMLVKLLMGIGLIGGGAGGAYGMMAAGMVGGGEHEKEDNSPKLVKKGDTDPYAPKSEDKENEGLAEVHGEGGSKYQTSYFSFSDEFTSNLRNSEALIQVSLACSTRRDGRVLMWVKKHELAIRSAMLTVLADTPEEDVYTIEGKKRLQKRLTGSINQVLTANEGFGGVDDVYFKTFIIQ
jgi:flagellar FliL protein